MSLVRSSTSRRFSVKNFSFQKLWPSIKTIDMQHLPQKTQEKLTKELIEVFVDPKEEFNITDEDVPGMNDDPNLVPKKANFYRMLQLVRVMQMFLEFVIHSFSFNTHFLLNSFLMSKKKQNES